MGNCPATSTPITVIYDSMDLLLKWTEEEEVGVDTEEAELNQYNNNKLMPLFSIITLIGESTTEDKDGKQSSKS